MQRLEVMERVVSCTACELHEKCNGPVPFSGPAPASIAVLGEAPGRQEDEAGAPFVGPAGQLLRQTLEANGLDLQSIAFINTVSCFPDDTPTLKQIQACAENKTLQIKTTAPSFVLIMGKVALKAMVPALEIKSSRQRPFMQDGVIYVAGYHPSAALRDEKMDEEFRKDIAFFAKVVNAGPDQWADFIPETCAVCVNLAIWWARSGIGWCMAHMPEREMNAYEERVAFLKADYEAAKARVVDLGKVQRTGQYLSENEEWTAAAWTELVIYVKGHSEFFVDDFWAAMEGRLGKPADARALGPLVQRASREGLIERTGEFRKSVNSNGSEKPVWVSKLATVATVAT